MIFHTILNIIATLVLLIIAIGCWGYSLVKGSTIDILTTYVSIRYLADKLFSIKIK